jgi:hypothetical protein
MFSAPRAMYVRPESFERSFDPITMEAGHLFWHLSRLSTVLYVSSLQKGLVFLYD